MCAVRAETAARAIRAEEAMTKLQTGLVILAAMAAAVPFALYAQSDVTDATTSKFAMVTDSKNGGVWRPNSNTGELWFCLASASPKCHLAENAKQ
jgi:hypothetical protein